MRILVLAENFYPNLLLKSFKGSVITCLRLLEVGLPRIRSETVLTINQMFIFELVLEKKNS